MRWDRLFDDLESQLEQERTAEEIGFEAEEERLRLSRLSLRDRLVAVHQAHSAEAGFSIRITLLSGEAIAVRPQAFGRDWVSALLVTESARHRQGILPLAAIAGIDLPASQARASLGSSLRSSPTDAAAPPPRLSDRLGLGFVLRDLSRRRVAVEVTDARGTARGTIDRVGRDHLDLAIHEAGSPRRESLVSVVRLIPLAGLQLVSF